MPELEYSITSAAPAHRGMTPLLRFGLQISAGSETQTIESVVLRTQIQFECPKRAYTDAEKRRLADLFGRPERWGDTVRNRLWTQLDSTIGTFSGSTQAHLDVPCTYDLNIASAKYLNALEGGEAHLLFLFSGTVFYRDSEDRLQMERVPWVKECAYRLPMRAWREMMDYHYPNSRWLYLDSDIFDRLAEHRRRQGHTTWEETIEGLLPRNREEVPA